jgi:hypothetical protein
MGWLRAGILAVVLVTVTGCPEDWRKGGALDRAAAKDTRENTPWLVCPEGKSVQWACPPDDPDPDQCGFLCQ